MTHGPALVGALGITASPVAFFFVRIFVHSLRFITAWRARLGLGIMPTVQSTRCVSPRPNRESLAFPLFRHEGVSTDGCEISKYTTSAPNATLHPHRYMASALFFLSLSPFPLVIHDTQVTEYPHVQPLLRNSTQPDWDQKA